MSTLLQTPEAGHSSLEREIPDNSAEYLLFILDEQSDARTTLSQLETLRKAALEFCRDLTKDYIWQRDEFNLELKNENGKFVRG